MTALGLAVSLGMFAFGVVAAGQEKAAGPSVVVGPNLRASANVKEGFRNECWIAASPKSPDLLVGVAQTAPSEESRGTGGRACATMVSHNGGQTWREVPLPKAGPGDFDPMVVAGPDGQMYVMFAFIGRPPADGDPQSSLGRRRDGVIRVWRTTDQGRTWKGPTEVFCPLQPDHPRMAVDLSNGEHRGRIYLAWNEVSDTIVQGRYHIFLNYSDDDGQTFSDPKLLEVDFGGKLVTTEPVVLSDGTLLVTYYQYFWPLADPKNETQPFYLIRSTDGAKTFEKPQKVTAVGSSAFRHLRRDFGSAFTLPIVIGDTSPGSRFKDRIYMVWDDTAAGESNIWLIMSSDKGRTWSKARRINDNKRDEVGPVDFRMTPVVHVNKDGVVGIAWYDRRDDPSHRCWKQYFTASFDGGETFLANQPVSSAPSCPGAQAPPTMNVWNTSPAFEDTLPSEEDLAKMPEMERRGWEEQLAVARAWRESNKGTNTAKLMVSFDRGRSVWPGHYTGLTSDVTGAFHALWSDRRNKLQQIFTARIDALPGQPSPPPESREAVVTGLVQLVASEGVYDAAKGTSTFDLQVRNVSDRPIYGPVKVRVTRMVPSLDERQARDKKAKAPVAVVDADVGGGSVGATWDFSKFLGGHQRLAPKGISEARKIVVRTNPDGEWDGTLEFEVTGRLTEPGQATGAVAGAPASPRPAADIVPVVIETSMGQIEVAIDTRRAPATAANFLKYVDAGLYDGGGFHRTVTPNNQPDDAVRIEVVQADMPKAKAAERRAAIALERTSVTGLRHEDGAISMARAAPDSAQSSFFICVNDQPALDFGGKRNPDGQGFAAFGRVTRGMDVVRKIQAAPSQAQALTPPIEIIRVHRVSGTAKQ